MERRCNPCARLRACHHTRCATRRSHRYAKPVYRGRRQRCSDRYALCAERQPAAGSKVQIQAGMDGTPAGARRRAYTLDAPVVLAGDYNVVPTDADIYPTKSYAKNALIQPEPRALFRRLLNQGWIDAIRTLHPTAPMYTFWDYMRNRWQRDAGLRIDHLLLNPKAAKRLIRSGVDREVRGAENASDHAPAWIMLRDARAASRKPIRSAAKLARTKTTRAAPRTIHLSRRPLLVIDGDSFTHRSYHALPKTILRRGLKPAGAILGFANLLLRSTARNSRAPC